MIKVGQLVKPSTLGLKEERDWDEDKIAKVLSINDGKLLVKWLDSEKELWRYKYKFDRLDLVAPSIFIVTNQGLLIGDNKKVSLFKYKDLKTITRKIPSSYFELDQHQFTQAIKGFENYLNSGVEIYEKIT